MQVDHLAIPYRTKAPAQDTALPRQGVATVVNVQDDGAIELDRRDGRWASLASSCLLRPETGDRVWFVAEGDECFVVAVLQRSELAGASRLHVSGDASLQVEGEFEMKSEGLSLRANGALGLAGDELTIHARAGRAVMQHLCMVVREVATSARKSTFVGGLVETFAEVLRSHSKASVRTVAQVDQVNAGTIDHRATGVAQLSAKQTLINGSEIIKADGAQIHLG